MNELTKEEVQYILNVLSQSNLRYIDTEPIIKKILKQGEKPKEVK